MPKWMVYETPINPEVVGYEIPMVWCRCQPYQPLGGGGVDMGRGLRKEAPWYGPARVEPAKVAT
jgi:hypothetical protein